MEEPLLKVAGFGNRDCSSIRLVTAARCQALAAGWLIAFKRLLLKWWFATTDRRFLEAEINFRH
eukprot:494580-Amphidinium_carterae.1